MAQNFDGLRQRAVFSFGLQKCICSGVQCFSPVAVVVAFVVPRLFLVLPRFSCSSSFLSLSLFFLVFLAGLALGFLGSAFELFSASIENANITNTKEMQLQLQQQQSNTHARKNSNCKLRQRQRCIGSEMYSPAEVLHTRFPVSTTTTMKIRVVL